MSDRLEAEIEIDYTGRGTIVVGGVDISNIVRRVEFKSSPGDVSEVAIVLGGHRVDLRHSSVPLTPDEIEDRVEAEVKRAADQAEPPAVEKSRIGVEE